MANDKPKCSCGKVARIILGGGKYKYCFSCWGKRNKKEV